MPSNEIFVLDKDQWRVVSKHNKCKKPHVQVNMPKLCKKVYRRKLVSLDVFNSRINVILQLALPYGKKMFKVKPSKSFLYEIAKKLNVERRWNVSEATVQGYVRVAFEKAQTHLISTSPNRHCDAPEGRADQTCRL